MAGATKKTKAAAEKAAKEALESKLIGSFDNAVGDVLKYAEEGRDLYFTDGKYFLELPDDVYKKLNPESKKRYSMAKRITLGEDVIGVSSESAYDVKFNYNKRHMDVSDQTAVFGKKQGMDYRWTRADKIHKRQGEGWVIDQDTDVKTRIDEGKVKTIGGQRAPEMVLMSMPTQVLNEKKAEKRKRTEMILSNNENKFKESVEKLGSKVIGDNA